MDNYKKQKIGQREFFDRALLHEENNNHLAKPFRDIASFYETRFTEDLISFIDDKSVRLILDLGCGDGKYSVLMAGKRDDAHIVGVDLSISQLRLTQNKITPSLRRRVSLVLCDSENLPFRNKAFDAALIVAVIHHLPSLDALGGIQRALKENGKFIINDGVSNNPLISLSKKIYRFIPKRIKTRMLDNGVVDTIDNPPEGLMFTDRELKHALAGLNFNILKKNQESLFFFVFVYLSIFPLFNRLASSSIIFSLHRIERLLIEHTPLRNFCRVVMYFCVLNRKAHE